MKTAIYEFIWKGKTDKVKRDIFEQDYSLGGFKMIDFNNMIYASSVMWIKRYLDDTDRNWKYTFEHFCNKLNLRIFLQSNFDTRELPKDLPLHYKYSITNWQNIFNHSENTSGENELSNCIWYNRNIKVGGNSIYNKNLMSIGMWTVADLYESDGQTIIPFTTWLKRGAVERDRLVWLGIINVIKHIQLNFCKSKMIKAGIYVNDKFIEVYNITQRDVTKLLSSKKYSKLKEVDFKFKAKANSIHGKINDDTWERLFYAFKELL